MRLELPSFNEVFDKFSEAAGRIPPIRGASVFLAVEVPIGSGEYRSVEFHDGRVVSIDSGCDDAAEVVLHLSEEPGLSLFSARQALQEEIAAGIIVTSIHDKHTVRWLFPPFDEPSVTAFAELPLIPGATALVSSAFINSPFGDLNYWTQFVDGQIAATGSEWRSDADVLLRVPFANFMFLRQGSFGLVEAIEGGDIGGSMAKIAVVGGIIDSSAYRDAWAQSCPATVELARLCQITATAEFQDLRHQVSQQIGL